MALSKEQREKIICHLFGWSDMVMCIGTLTWNKWLNDPAEAQDDTDIQEIQRLNSLSDAALMSLILGAKDVE